MATFKLKKQEKIKLEPETKPSRCFECAEFYDPQGKKNVIIRLTILETSIILCKRCQKRLKVRLNMSMSGAFEFRSDIKKEFENENNPRT
jgi:RNase P subunit RPR2